MTPSRSAHGQISSSGRSKMSSTASATSAPATTWWARLARDPGQGGDLVGGAIATSLGIQLVELAGGEDPAYEQALAGRRRTADARQRAERLRGRDRVVGRPAAQQRAGVVGDLGADPAGAPAAARHRRGRRRRSARGSAGPRRAAATRRRRAPRRRRRRSRASRRRCRRRPAGRTTSRTSGVRPGRSAAPRPHPGAPGCRRRCASRPGRSTSSQLSASRTAEVAKE